MSRPQNPTPEQCAELINIITGTDEISVFLETHTDIFISFLESLDAPLLEPWKSDAFVYYRTMKQFFEELQKFEAV
jgi:hypothetical protein